VTPDVYTIFAEGIRSLFLLGVPIAGAALAAGFVSSLLQTVLAIQDPVLLYAGRLLAVVGVIYALVGSFQSSLVALFRLALQ
jgi:flagellar biosynthesis protein FliQ